MWLPQLCKHLVCNCAESERTYHKAHAACWDCLPDNALFLQTRSTRLVVGACLFMPPCRSHKLSPRLQACEHYMDAGAISDVVNGAVKAKEMLELETTVLQCLEFDLVVYEPFLCIDAMIEVRALRTQMG